MELVRGLDISDLKLQEWITLKNIWKQSSNKWYMALYVMPETLMISLAQWCKTPMKLVTLTIEFKDENDVTTIKIFNNVEFTPHQQFGFSLPKARYIKLLKVFMESNEQDYKDSNLTMDEYKILSQNPTIICLDSGDILNVLIFNEYVAKDMNDERRSKRRIERLSRGLKW